MPHSRFTRVLSVLLVLAIVAVLTLALTGDAISDFLFSLPAWVPVAIVVGYPVVIGLVVAFFTVASRGDRMAAEACRRNVTERQERAAASDLRVQRNVVALPQRAPAKVVPFPTDRSAS